MQVAGLPAEPGESNLYSIWDLSKASRPGSIQSYSGAACGILDLPCDPRGGRNAVMPY